MNNKPEIITVHESVLIINMLLCLIYIVLAKFFDSGNYDVAGIATVLCIGFAGFVSTKTMDSYYAKESKKGLQKLGLKHQQHTDHDNTEAYLWKTN